MNKIGDEFLTRARGPLPMLAARESGVLAQFEVAGETIADFHRAGILRVLQPRAFRGVQGSFLTFSHIVEELAATCASSAWVYPLQPFSRCAATSLSRSAMCAARWNVCATRSGPHIVYDNSPLQAILRDVLTISNYRVWSWERAMLPYEKWVLNGQP